MKGCRPLADLEIRAVVDKLITLRDRALFVLGVRSGFRISELLSLKVRDVYQYGAMMTRVQVQRRHMKKKIEGRSVALHDEAKVALLALITGEQLQADDYLFQSKKGNNKPITRVQAFRILKAAYAACEIEGKVATHTMRKTFAAKVYAAVKKDIVKTQKALGHKNLNSTASYLSFADEEIDDAILGVA